MREVAKSAARPQTTFARQLRAKQTDAEKALWLRLQNKQLEGVKFRRQEPIGCYVVDFVSFEERLVVEVDGGQHGEETAEVKDRERMAWLESQGFRVLRFWNNEVLTNMEGVLRQLTLTLFLSHQGRGNRQNGEHPPPGG